VAVVSVTRGFDVVAVIVNPGHDLGGAPSKFAARWRQGKLDANGFDCCKHALDQTIAAELRDVLA
jgi:hypothetical protein